MAFIFTVIPDFVFDQVLSFTLGNTILDNAQATHDSFSEEHTYSDGTHARISEDANFIINPDGHMGLAFWWDGGHPTTDYNVPGTDTDQAIAGGYAAPNFLATNRVNIFPWGSFFSLVPTPATSFCDLSEAMSLSEGREIVLSFLSNITGYVDGSMYVDLVCYDAAGFYQGIICQTQLSADEVLWTPHEATGMTLANGVGGATADTAYVRIRRWINSTADATAWRLTRKKLEKGNIARYYSDESSMPQYLSARYHMTLDSETGTILTGVTTILDFNIIDFDDPGANRVSVDDGGANRWRYTADRYQKLRLSFRIEGRFFAGSLDPGEEIRVALYKNGVVYSTLFSLLGDVLNVPSGHNFELKGTDTIELNKSDYLDLRMLQNSGTAFVIRIDLDTISYINIEEF